MSRLIDIASAEIGVKELDGQTHNPRILQYAKEAGFDWYNADETPWCSIFLNWVALKAGLSRSKDGRSGSWANVGKPVTDPQPGDVILCGKGGNINQIYHVGLFTGFSQDQKFVFCLGGNQTNQVNIAKMPASEVAGFRRIEELQINEVPTDTTQPRTNLEDSTLTAASQYTENQIIEIQKSLKASGLYNGAINGQMDAATQKAMKDFQELAQKMRNLHQ